MKKVSDLAEQRQQLRVLQALVDRFFFTCWVRGRMTCAFGGSGCSHFLRKEAAKQTESFVPTQQDTILSVSQNRNTLLPS